MISPLGIIIKEYTTRLTTHVSRILFPQITTQKIVYMELTLIQRSAINCIIQSWQLQSHYNVECLGVCVGGGGGGEKWIGV